MVRRALRLQVKHGIYLLFAGDRPGEEIVVSFRSHHGLQLVKPIMADRRGPPHGDHAARLNLKMQAFEIGREKTGVDRSEAHTSELQTLLRISYVVICA